ncbi:energy-coupling factor transport system substrate-specific component [Agromyces hippuratus]|uniref:Energy-coupling factor transport system substrate-specific component n=1 Tax=Agromyces hippuratus TaxID=286438 RepID=A0A852WR83_9MICO|nr:ECF transporter S component [Agromyces hippuratus]NYG20267.1 energy-coupling factor transport system substrate-specific component [Agromyces hippuratus]
MHTAASETSSPSTPRKPRDLRWRVVDIVVASVIGVATGLLFLFWNNVGYAWFSAADALTPGLGGIAVGIWLIGGVLGGLIIRKPGAALFVELLAAIVSALVGNQWGIETIYSGVMQGLGAELVFAVFAYRRFGLLPAMLAGAAAGAAAWTLELFTSGNLAKSAEFLGLYFTTVVISGAVLAGLLGWLIVRGLAATGALNRFAAGQDVAQRV